MPKEFQLEVAPNMKGPWRVVHKAQLEELSGSGAQGDNSNGGENSNTDGGGGGGGGGGVEFQQFDAFQADSQYWRLQTMRNYGAHATKVHSISFEGVERPLRKFFVENGFNQYFDDFVVRRCSTGEGEGGSWFW